MLHRVPLVTTKVSAKLNASIIRVTVFLRSVFLLVVTTNVVPISPILLIIMMEVIRFWKTSVLIRVTAAKTSESYMTLSDWTLQLRCNVFYVKYELGFYIPEDCILQTVWTVQSSKFLDAHVCYRVLLVFVGKPSVSDRYHCTHVWHVTGESSGSPVPKFV
jgi:hypothetical protein